MKTREDFEIFKNIATLNHYLYMDKDNYVEYFNGVATLRITLNDDYEYQMIKP